MTEEDLISNGYTRFKNYTQSYASYGLQKKFRDGKGIKYFITYWVYSEIAFGFGKAFEPNVQFQRTNKPTINLQLLLLPSTTVSAVEDEVEAFWSLSGSEYYELF